MPAQVLGNHTAQFRPCWGSERRIAASSLTARRYEGDSGGTAMVGHLKLCHLNPAIQSRNATGVSGNQTFAGLIWQQRFRH